MSATWTACGSCNRGGNGNDKDKCSCGWSVTKVNELGCFCGTPIDGPIKPRPKLTRSQQRYQMYLESREVWNTFKEFLQYTTIEARERREHGQR